MGQRLVIRNELNGKFANEIYWHGSGFTDVATIEAFNLSEFLEDKKILNNDEFNRLCYMYISKKYGGLFYTNDYVRKLLSGLEIKAGDRSFGIIAFEDKENQLMQWADISLVINWITKDGKIDKKLTTLNLEYIFYHFTDSEHFEKFMEVKISELDIKCLDFEKIPLSALFDLGLYIYHSKRGFISSEGKIYSKVTYNS